EIAVGGHRARGIIRAGAVGTPLLQLDCAAPVAGRDRRRWIDPGDGRGRYFLEGKYHYRTHRVWPCDFCAVLVISQFVFGLALLGNRDENALSVLEPPHFCHWRDN